MRKWRVTLKSGETSEVNAINEWHAGSCIVYGGGPAKIDGRTGQAIGAVVVHRDNIASVELLQ